MFCKVEKKNLDNLFLDSLMNKTRVDSGFENSILMHFSDFSEDKLFS